MNNPQGLAHAKLYIQNNLNAKNNSLDLGNCGLYDLKELPDLWKCNHLEKLIFGSWYLVNNIGDEGAKAIAKNLTKLKSLDLWSNQIGDEGGKVIAEGLINLIDLNLASNNITTISPFLPYIERNPKLIITCDNEHIQSGFNVTKNPLIDPPLEVVKLGREAILRYYENLKKEKVLNLAPFINKEVKLILAGNSNAGKSTLVKYLTDGMVDKKLPSTHWMEVKNWEKPFPTKPQVENIRIFDFGGQEFYHDTHHLFFTNNTVYIILWEKEGNTFKDITVTQKSPVDFNEREIQLKCFPIEYWMDSISHFIDIGVTKETQKSRNTETEKQIEYVTTVDPKYWKEVEDYGEKYLKVKPPLFLVQNKVDKGRSYKLGLDNYENKFPKLDIVDAVAISIYENRNLDNLKNILCEVISEMNLVGGKFQGTYGIIRQELINFNGKISITFDEFIKQCNEWILDAGNHENKDYISVQFSYLDAWDCANVFNWLGYILFFPISPKLRNKVFINHQLITNSIYKILFNAETTFGEIDKKEAKAKTDLTDENINDILALMQEFKIIFKHPDPNKTDTYIAPLYLSEQPTKGISFFLSSLQKPFYRIQYDGFIHKSIILEFFQEYGQHVLKESNVSHEDVFYYWRNGIVVKKAANSGKESLVLIQFFNGEDKLNKVGKTERVAAHIDIFSLKEGSVDLIKEIKDKLADINKGWKVTEMVTVDGHQFVPLAEILEHEANKQFVFQYANQQFQLIHFKQYLTKEYPMKKVFISYSKSDEHYRNELEKHLSVLKRNGHIATWHDRKLLPGEKWDGKIKQELKEADIILFLVSADFLATDYIWDVEIGTALERDKDPNDKVIIIPIILKKCDWEDSPLGKFNSPVKGADISTQPDKDEAIYEIVKELKELIK